MKFCFRVERRWMGVVCGVGRWHEFFLKTGGAVLLGVAGLVVGSTEEFDIELGDPVSMGVPGPGAGFLESVEATDTYRFAAEAGQIVFLEELQVASTFEGWLYWEVRAPSNLSIAGGYFQGAHEGRRVLPESGTYVVRVRVLDKDPGHVGSYSFRIRRLPADSTFVLELGDSVSDGVPAPGAGRIEEAGVHDVYQFQADAGALAFFERVSAAPGFGGWLQWELNSPGGQVLFRSYFGSGHDGRKMLPESGLYTLRVADGTSDETHAGDYAFRIRGIPPDQIYSIQVGQTIADGAPGNGAGRIEAPGSWDYYTFTGVTGQSLYFEDLAVASTLGGWLQWEVKSPSGQLLFNDYFGGGKAGRKTLPETGTYTIRCYVGNNDPELTGPYSFRIGGINDDHYPVAIGDVVTNGFPALGAGVIETAGGEDTFTFPGTAGHEIVLEELSADTAFAGWLRWEIKAPDGTILQARYFQPGHSGRLVLPATGTYHVRVFAGAPNPEYVGNYSFRTYSEVVARRDQFGVRVGGVLEIPKQKFLCNDECQPVDSLSVELPEGVSSQGGVLVDGHNTILYAAPVAFSGIDTFRYRIRGQFGGVDTAVVTIRVYPEADAAAHVASVVRSKEGAVEVCLLGLPGQTYGIEESEDLVEWVSVGQITADNMGAMGFQYSAGTPDKLFYRFPKR